MKRFWVSTSHTGYKRTVQIIVYDELDEMQEAAKRYIHASEGAFSYALAVSQPRESYPVYEDGSYGEPSTSAGVIRFVKGYMGAGVVAHEMVHMALAIYRRDRKRAPLGNMKNEETLCHIVSDLTARAVNKFYAAGLYEGS